MNSNSTPISSDFFLYKDSNEEVKVEIYKERVWLPQDQIAQLFGVHRSVVTKHLKNVYKRGELLKEKNLCNFCTSSMND